jgi:hypothetical protein
MESDTTAKSESERRISTGGVLPAPLCPGAPACNAWQAFLAGMRDPRNRVSTAIGVRRESKVSEDSDLCRVRGALPSLQSPRTNRAALRAPNGYPIFEKS